MDLKPKKPQKKKFEKLKPLEDAIAQTKNTEADTKALETAQKELDTATNALAVAMEESHKSYEKAFKLTGDVSKTPVPPVPIPYPVITKQEKETKGAVQRTEKALKKHEKASKKLLQVIDKQIKVLKPATKISKSEAATATKGLISSKLAGKSQWAQYSVDVKAESKNVHLLFDIVSKNNK